MGPAVLSRLLSNYLGQVPSPICASVSPSWKWVSWYCSAFLSALSFVEFCSQLQLGNDTGTLQKICAGRHTMQQSDLWFCVRCAASLKNIFHLTLHTVEDSLDNISAYLSTWFILFKCHSWLKQHLYCYMVMETRVMEALLETKTFNKNMSCLWVFSGISYLLLLQQ